MVDCPRCGFDFELSLSISKCPKCGLGFTTGWVGETWSGDEYMIVEKWDEFQPSNRQVGNEVATIAFHGDGATPEMLREDIGEGLHVDYFVDKYHAASFCREFPEVNLVGYSRGGGVIADLSCILPNIRSAVLYESPLGAYNKAMGSFPALIIWNKRGRKSKAIYRSAVERMEDAWVIGRHVDFLEGTGRHIRVDRSMRPRLRHGWDRSLNPKISQWIKDLKFEPETFA
jgi:hypothetical protein